MKYDFETIIDRCHKDAIAIDAVGSHHGTVPNGPKEGFSLIPMWVADMNFTCCPDIQEEIIKRTNHGCFGYFDLTDEYFDSIINWQKENNGVDKLTKDNIGYENGVLGGVISALDAFCSKGDNVLLHSPTYIGFTFSLKNSGYNIIHSQLYLDENNVWRMNYKEMDELIKKHNIHAAIFCSPHNPTGRVWEKEEIEKAMQVYKDNDCIVISDEIWSDLVLDNHKHIPTQSVSEDARNRTVAMYAPSKTFNLAGLVGSYHIIYNKYVNDRVTKQSSLSHYNSCNVLSMHALIGAYSKNGLEWKNELVQVLGKNVDYGYKFITEHFDGVTLSKPQGTYMLYLDCEEWCKKHDKTLDELLQMGNDVGIAWQDGRPFHRPYAIRMNLALPYSLIVEAFDRLDKHVFNK